MTGFIASLLKGSGDNVVLEALKARADLAFALVEQRLGDVPYLAGDKFTAADIMMGFPLTTMRAFTPRDLCQLPNLRTYLKLIGERPAYRRAMAAGDPSMTPMLG